MDTSQLSDIYTFLVCITSTVFIFAGVLLTTYAVFSLRDVAIDPERSVSVSGVLFVLVCSNSPIYAGVLILAALNGSI